ncbi:MAG: prephenate dehydrogenase/arogenate dehydrogenase family protein [Candidatus Zixiibacteriota bacterium]
MNDLKDKTILIIGLGQIGGSIGIDLVRSRSVGLVIGYDINYKTMLKAKKIGAVERIVKSIENGIRQADIIILATPIGVIVRFLLKICRLCNQDQIILDVAGTKNEIFKKLNKINTVTPYYGGHPMAGTEKIGINAAVPNLFNGVPFIITPHKNGNKESYQAVINIIKLIKATPFEMGNDRHDELMARISHLPYLLAICLLQLISSNEDKSFISSMTGGSFLSATRVAGSSPELTRDMFLTNCKNFKEAIEQFEGIIADFKKQLIADNKSGLLKIIEKAHTMKQELFHA